VRTHVSVRVRVCVCVCVCALLYVFAGVHVCAYTEYCVCCARVCSGHMWNGAQAEGL